jgi:hypothetical protein
MRLSVTIAMLLVSVGFLKLSAQQNATQRPTGARPSNQSSSYRTVQASDGTFVVQLPIDWQIRNLQVKSSMAQSPRGESVAWGVISAIDIQHFQAYQRLLGQFAGYASQVFPVVADPMPPSKVVRELYPRFYPGAQNIQILGAPPAGQSTALTFYQYSQAYSQLTRGAALICVSPPQPGNFGIWTIAYWKAEAPVWLFERSMPTFETIFSSLRYDINRIFSMIAANQAAATQTTRGTINAEAEEYRRQSQMINQFGQNMQTMQTQLYETFRTGSLERDEDEIATLAGKQWKIDANGIRYEVRPGDDCVNTITQQSTSSNNRGCDALVGPGWIQVTPPPVR